jgi:hypothetical protein
MGCVVPQDGFLETLREVTDECGSLLIFDEIITGFRHDLGGVQKLESVTPDLTTMGKSVANGYPMSILCGKAEYMNQLAPAGARDPDAAVARNLRGRVLFDEGVDAEELRTRYDEGWRCQVVTVEDPEDDLGDYVNGPCPLFRVSSDGTLDAFTVDHRPTIDEGDRVLLFGPDDQ